MYFAIKTWSRIVDSKAGRDTREWMKAKPTRGTITKVKMGIGTREEE